MYATAAIRNLRNTTAVDRLRRAGFEVTSAGPAALKARIDRERPLWRDIAKAAGLQPTEAK